MIDRTKAFFRRSRTIFVARLYVLVGVLVTAEPWVAGQDWTPLMTRIYGNVPPDLRPLAIGATVAATGAVFEYMRRITRNPLPTEPPISPGA